MPMVLDLVTLNCFVFFRTRFNDTIPFRSEWCGCLVR